MSRILPYPTLDHDSEKLPALLELLLPPSLDLQQSRKPVDWHNGFDDDAELRGFERLIEDVYAGGHDSTGVF